MVLRKDSWYQYSIKHYIEEMSEMSQSNILIVKQKVITALNGHKMCVLKKDS